MELEVAYFHDRPGAKEKFIEAGIPLIHVPHGRSRALTVWRLRRVIKERQPDVVHTMVFEADIIGRTAAFLAHVPVMSSIINEMYGPAQLGGRSPPVEDAAESGVGHRDGPIRSSVPCDHAHRR